jgi:hypothetical protein
MRVEKRKIIFLRMNEIWEKSIFSNGFLLEIIRKYGVPAFSNSFIVETVRKGSDIYFFSRLFIKNY